MKQSDFFWEKDFPDKYVCGDCGEENDGEVKRCKNVTVKVLG